MIDTDATHSRRSRPAAADGRPHGRGALSLEQKVAFLRDSDAYPERPPRVESIETHMSWLFLTPDHVYKLKKPVRSGSLDYGTIAARARNCKRETRLNQPLAPGVYLGVVPLCADDGRLRLGAGATVVDWLVKMRRLPAERMFDRLLQRRAVGAAEVRGFTRVLGGFYQSAAPIAMTGAAYLRRLERSIVATRGQLSRPAYALPAGRVRAASTAQLAFVAREHALLAQRAEGRRIIEAHGDLRPEHVCLTTPPVVIDRLEFDRDLRILDPVDELSYLALECERLGSAPAGALVLRTYAETTHDDPGTELVRFYKGFRAFVRAMVAIRHLEDDQVRDHAKWIRRAGDYLALAQIYAG